MGSGCQWPLKADENKGWVIVQIIPDSYHNCDYHRRDKQLPDVGIQGYVFKDGETWDAQLAPAPRCQARDAARTDHVLPGAQEAGRRSSAFVLGMCRHPQRKYRFQDKCTRGISPQRISERHCL